MQQADLQTSILLIMFRDYRNLEYSAPGSSTFDALICVSNSMLTSMISEGVSLLVYSPPLRNAWFNTWKKVLRVGNRDNHTVNNAKPGLLIHRIHVEG